MTDSKPITRPVACVSWWFDPCQDRHIEPAPDYVAVRKSDLDRLRSAVETAIEYCDYEHVKRQIREALRFHD